MSLTCANAAYLPMGAVLTLFASKGSEGCPSKSWPGRAKADARGGLSG
jgi:hypothetical protein